MIWWNSDLCLVLKFPMALVCAELLSRGVWMIFMRPGGDRWSPLPSGRKSDVWLFWWVLALPVARLGLSGKASARGKAWPVAFFPSQWSSGAQLNAGAQKPWTQNNYQFNPCWLNESWESISSDPRLVPTLRFRPPGRETRPPKQTQKMSLRVDISRQAFLPMGLKS